MCIRDRFICTSKVFLAFISWIASFCHDDMNIDVCLWWYGTPLIVINFALTAFLVYAWMTIGWNDPSKIVNEILFYAMIIVGTESVTTLVYCAVIIADPEDTVHRNRLPNYIPVFCLLYTSPSPRDQRGSRMPSSA
eukprot:TRINITY_DN6121_c0_g1_i4.p1 TRINITY_DN6121_c0_g1~~TRINITY_DN6121_c0_g1_i4.p1  ORF type:complete len:136 (+),score=39.73 TRINITY_DN6121_c0_g1_i4:64-471(+)